MILPCFMFENSAKFFLRQKLLSVTFFKTFITVDQQNYSKHLFKKE